jgi:hypothetical protein
MTGAKKHLVLAVAVVAVVVCVILPKAVLAQEESQIGQAQTVGSHMYPAIPGCPRGAFIGPSNGWQIQIENRCSTNTINVALKYMLKGQWYEVGYWTLPPGAKGPVVITDNRYFVYYGYSSDNSKFWAGNHCLNPCGKGKRCGGRQVYIDMDDFGTYIQPFRC